MVTVSESFWSDLKFIETWLSCFCRSAVDRQSALQTAEKENTDHIPFTLTSHPHNHAVKSIIKFKNFTLFQND